MAWRTLDDMDFAGKRALVRVDINVPVEDGVVTDTTRIERIIPTVDDIHEKGGKVILMAHFGRPKGQVVPEMSLEHTAGAVADVFGLTVTWVNSDYADAVAEMDVRRGRIHAEFDAERAAELQLFGEFLLADDLSAAP